jgi:hypothetical protein
MIHRFGRTRRTKSRDMDSYLVVCDRSGFVTDASKCVFDPESGGFVRADFVDKINPQKFLKLRREDRSVPVAREWRTDTYVDTSLPPSLD